LCNVERASCPSQARSPLRFFTIHLDVL
jgi:hypothetical protein